MELKRKSDYYSFLLRLWRVNGNREHKKRATIENVESGEKHGFTSLEELLAYLTELTAIWDESSGEGNE